MDLPFDIFLVITFTLQDCIYNFSHYNFLNKPLIFPFWPTRSLNLVSSVGFELFSSVVNYILHVYVGLNELFMISYLSCNWIMIEIKNKNRVQWNILWDQALNRVSYYCLSRCKRRGCSQIEGWRLNWRRSLQSYSTTKSHKHSYSKLI